MIALDDSDPHFRRQAKLLAEKLKLPMAGTLPSGSVAALLRYDQRGLNIVLPEPINMSYVVDFESSRSAHRLRHRQRELLLRAVSGQTVCDLTCGFATDAFVLAASGMQVAAVEQNPIIFELLQDAKLRLENSNPELAARISFYNCTAEYWLEHNTHTYDNIYLDPMFPERKKSAKVKKPAQILQFLNDDMPLTDWNSLPLFAHCKRVVIKRPLHAENLLQRKPTFTQAGKTCRFDVFL